MCVKSSFECGVLNGLTFAANSGCSWLNCFGAECVFEIQLQVVCLVHIWLFDILFDNVL